MKITLDLDVQVHLITYLEKIYKLPRHKVRNLLAQRLIEVCVDYVEHLEENDKLLMSSEEVLRWHNTK